MDKIAFPGFPWGDFIASVVLPGIGLGLAGLAVFYYVLPKIFRLKKRNEENKEG